MRHGARRVLSRLASRLVLSGLVLVLSGLLAATLVRVAPGFGMDERLLDARLSPSSLEAIERETAGHSNVLRYYTDYLRNLARGDLGDSISLRRPVKELLSERAAVTVRSGAAGLALAWAAGVVLVSLTVISRRRSGDAFVSLLGGVLLCLPAAMLAVLAAYLGASPAIAIGAIVFPRVYRYLRNVARQSCAAPHVLAAHAAGLGRLQILVYYVAAPVLPEFFALAGVSVSMAVGATIPVEALCDSPGIGQLVWQAAIARDLPVMVNVTLLITALTVTANLLADLGRGMREVQA